MAGQSACMGPERVAASMGHERAVSGHTCFRWMGSGRAGCGLMCL